MRTVYIDSEYKCHVVNDGTRIAIDTDFFDGKCDAYIKGYCFEPYGDDCYKIYPWKSHSELDVAQREYEKQLLIEYETIVNELYSEVTADG